MADDLKPCPFCSSVQMIVTRPNDWGFCVMCANCGAESGVQDTRERAARAWNRRVPEKKEPA